MTEQLEAEVKRLSLSFPNGHNFSYRGYGYDIYSPTIGALGRNKYIDKNVSFARVCS